MTQTSTTPTVIEQQAAKNIDAPDGETPRYARFATLTYLAPEGWFVVWGNEVHPYGSNYPDALSAWEKVAEKSPLA